MPAASRPRVLLADDYPAIISALRRMLEPEYEVVGDVPDGAALIEAATRLLPDIVLLDLNLPEIGGLDACRQIKRAAPQVKVIFLTATENDAVKQRAFAMGASAFVTKSQVVDQLLPALRRAWLEDPPAAPRRTHGS